ncbi:Hypothetical protein D9617_15g043950 [Elsinoe fawcettii]|nr:Hypothetical protein D9617_15g043950 [Elsinoe fawcettii]
MPNIFCRSLQARAACINGFRRYDTSRQLRAVHQSSLRQATKPAPDKQKPEELLARLFPEEYAAKSSKEERERRLKSLKSSIPIQRPRKEEKVSLEIDTTKWDKKEQVGSKGLLRLDSASKNLAPEDFYRLMPQAKNLEGWALRMGAIEKVIPGRDMDTLERRDYYYLVFESIRSAEEYCDRAHRVAKLYDLCGPPSHVSDRPIPPGLVRPGESPYQVAKLYTLGPHGHPLDLRLMKPPFRENPRNIITVGGYGPIVKRPWKSPAEVTIRAGLSHLSYLPLRRAFEKAEKERNLPWTGDEFGTFKLSVWKNVISSKSKNQDKDAETGQQTRPANEK